MDRLLKIQDVCTLLKLGKRKVYELTADGTIPSVHVGKSLRYFESAVQTYIANLDAPRKPPVNPANEVQS